MFDQRVDCRLVRRYPWNHQADRSEEVLVRSSMVQPVLEAVLKLKRDNGLTAERPSRACCDDIFQSGFEHRRGRPAFGPKDRPWTKEQADYNLKYLNRCGTSGRCGRTGAAASHRVSGPATRMRCVGKVEIHADEDLTARYPRELGTRITIRTKTGKIFDSRAVRTTKVVSKPALVGTRGRERNSTG